jgi:hypothetical protein
MTDQDYPCIEVTTGDIPKVLTQMIGFQPVDCMGIIVVMPTDPEPLPSPMGVVPLEDIDPGNVGAALGLFGTCLQSWQEQDPQHRVMPPADRVIFWLWVTNDGQKDDSREEHIETAKQSITAATAILGIVSGVDIIQIVGTTQGLWKEMCIQESKEEAALWRYWQVGSEWKSRHQVGDIPEALEFWKQVRGFEYAMEKEKENGN